MTTARRVLAFYRFVQMNELPELQRDLQQLCEHWDIKGTILLADEGVNGTVVGSADALTALQTRLTQIDPEIGFKWSDLDADNPGFYRLKVRIKPEIVSFGVPDLDVSQTGVHVDAQTWNALLDDPDVVVVDTRNTYEIDIGSFTGAINPQTTNFREFPAWADVTLQQSSKVAMFCTGGIRCEKASAYLRAQGFDEVYQLNGGILQYLEDVPPEENRWAGECFVFDQRVSVDAQLEQGQYQQCFACRHPVSAADMASQEYEQGVSCPHCFADVKVERSERLRERQRQVQLAESRGDQHIGAAQNAIDK